MAEQAAAAACKSVKAATVLVGKLTSVVPSSLQFLFEMMDKPTALKDTVLTIKEIPVRVRCEKCKTEWAPSAPVFVCEKCGSTKATVLSGQELTLQSIEVEN